MEERKSILFSFMGLGYGGSRIAATFLKEHNYPAYAVNTAKVDLGKIPVPKSHKLFLKNPFGGAGRDIRAGEKAILNNTDAIRDFIRLNEIQKSEYVIQCAGGGGGTGTGGALPMAKILIDEGVNVGIIMTLPLESEDIETKRNCLMAIKEIYESRDIRPFIIVDNNKISTRYPNISIADFWARANKDITLTFHMLNRYSSEKGLIYSLDSADYRKIITTPGCLVMGETTVKDFQSKAKLAEGLRESISKGLYASDFNLSSSDKVGIILRGSPLLFKKIAEKDITYAFKHIKEVARAKSIYWGIYADHAYKDRIRVHSIFSGLELPIRRIQALIDETKSEIEFYEEKRSVKSTGLDFDFFFDVDGKK